MYVRSSCFPFGNEGSASSGAGSFSRCPARILFGSTMSFFAAIASGASPYWAAIERRVSPAWTTCSLGKGLGVAVEEGEGVGWDSSAPRTGVGDSRKMRVGRRPASCSSVAAVAVGCASRPPELVWLTNIQATAPRMATPIVPNMASRVLDRIAVFAARWYGSRPARSHLDYRWGDPARPPP